MIDSSGEAILAEETFTTIAWNKVILSHVGWPLVLVLQVFNVGTIHSYSCLYESITQIHLELGPTIPTQVLVPWIILVSSHVFDYQEDCKYYSIKDPKEYS